MITSFPGGLECRTVGSKGSFGLHVVEGYVVGMTIPLCRYISISRVYHSIFQVEVEANSDEN